MSCFWTPSAHYGRDESGLYFLRLLRQDGSRTGGESLLMGAFFGDGCGKLVRQTPRRPMPLGEHRPEGKECECHHRHENQDTSQPVALAAEGGQSNQASYTFGMQANEPSKESVRFHPDPRAATLRRHLEIRHRTTGPGLTGQGMPDLVKRPMVAPWFEVSKEDIEVVGSQLGVDDA